MYRNFHLKVAKLQEGRESLTCCDMFRMDMPVGKLLKHQRMVHCFKNTEMRIIHREVEVASCFSDMEFSLNREEGDETIEGIALFKQLGRLMDQSDDDWPVVRMNIGNKRQV